MPFFLARMLVGQAIMGLMQFLRQRDLDWQQLGEINLVAVSNPATQKHVPSTSVWPSMI
jgi:hypothetical protein